MSKKLIHFAALAAATVFSSLSMADGLADCPSMDPVGPGKTRDQVVEEMRAFKRNPVVGAWRQLDTDTGWVYVGSSAPGKSREEVRGELEAFQRDRAAQAKIIDLYGRS